MSNFPFPRQERISKKQARVIEHHKPRHSPRDAVELPVKDRPKDGCREKRICVRGHVHENMHEPAYELEADLLEIYPHGNKYRRENNKTVAYVIEDMRKIGKSKSIRVGWFGNRWAPTEVGKMLPTKSNASHNPNERN